MAIRLANTLVLQNSSVAIEDLTDISLSFQKNSLDVTTNDSAGWGEILGSTKRVTITASAYVDFSATEGFGEAIADFTADTLITWNLKSSGTTENFSGSGRVMDITFAGQTEEALKYDFTIESSGAVTVGAGI